MEACFGIDCQSEYRDCYVAITVPQGAGVVRAGVRQGSAAVTSATAATAAVSAAAAAAAGGPPVC